MSDQRSLSGRDEPPPPYTPSPEPQAGPVQVQLPPYSPEQSYAPAISSPNQIPGPDQQPNPEVFDTRSYYAPNRRFVPDNSSYTHSLDLPRSQDPVPPQSRAASNPPVRHQQSSSGLRSKWRRLKAENEERKSTRVYCTPAEAAAISGRNNAGYEWEGYVSQERDLRGDGRRRRFGEDETVQRSRDIAQEQAYGARRSRGDRRWLI
ncbi:hypothetical protein BKA63DRAFT_492044 [Paraphoma chrysanthemicola]|nr:hypothetical protein BKA63DRAFT_492044 [Paraphoma chrysanthemicola]